MNSTLYAGARKRKQAYLAEEMRAARRQTKTALLRAVLASWVELLKFCWPEVATDMRTLTSSSDECGWARNSVKILESRIGFNSVFFSDLVELSRRKILEFFRFSARPFDHKAFYMVVLSQAECDRQFRLR